MTETKRSKGEPFFNEPVIKNTGGQTAVEPIEPETKPEPQNAPAPVSVPEGDKLNFSKLKWAGVVDVFGCNTCQTQRNDKDEIILHILTHVPASEQNALLDRLTKEK